MQSYSIHKTLRVWLGVKPFMIAYFFGKKDVLVFGISVGIFHGAAGRSMEINHLRRETGVRYATSPMIQVLLADDHKLVRDGLKSLLSGQAEDMQVVAEAATGQQVLTLLETTTADVVLMDIDMPEGNGIATTRQVRERFSGVKVLMLTMADNAQWVREALAAGAQGYLLKSSGHKELLHAIRTIHQGNEYFSTDLTKLLLHQGSQAASGATAALAAGDPAEPPQKTAAQPLAASVSPRELEVLRLIAKGHTNQQIAEMLFNSRRTVETHRQNLLEKTGANNTATLILYAAAHGLLE